MSERIPSEILWAKWLRAFAGVLKGMIKEPLSYNPMDQDINILNLIANMLEEVVEQKKEYEKTIDLQSKAMEELADQVQHTRNDHEVWMKGKDKIWVLKPDYDQVKSFAQELYLQLTREGIPVVRRHSGDQRLVDEFKKNRITCKEGTIAQAMKDEEEKGDGPRGASKRAFGSEDTR